MKSIQTHIRSLSCIALACASLVLGSRSSFAAEQRESIIDKIQHEGTLRVCVAVSVPWMMKDPNSDKFIGFDADMMGMLAQEMEVKLDLVGFPNFGQLIAGLQAGRCDLIAPFVRTTKRAVAVAFSETYFTLGTVWAVNKDKSTATTLQDLNVPATIVAVEQGTLSEQRTKTHLPNATIKSLQGGGDAQRIAELQSGRSTATALDSIKVPIYRQEFTWMRFIPENGFDDPVDRAGLAYAVRREDLDFVNLLNIFIWNLKANGTIDSLVAKWVNPKWFQH